eukprot:gene25709-biopygen13548
MRRESTIPTAALRPCASSHSVPRCGTTMQRSKVQPSRNAKEQDADQPQCKGKVHPSRNAWRQQQVERCFGCPELRDPRRWPIKKRGGINDPQGWRWAARRRWRRGGGEESCAGVSREKRPRTRPGRVPDAPHTIEFEETDESSAVSPSPPKSAYPA